MSELTSFTFCCELPESTEPRSPTEVEEVCVACRCQHLDELKLPCPSPASLEKGRASSVKPEQRERPSEWAHAGFQRQVLPFRAGPRQCAGLGVLRCREQVPRRPAVAHRDREPLRECYRT